MTLIELDDIHDFFLHREEGFPDGSSLMIGFTPYNSKVILWKERNKYYEIKTSKDLTFKLDQDAYLEIKSLKISNMLLSIKEIVDIINL